MRVLRWLSGIGLALIASSALAATYAVELPPQTDKAAADQLLADSAVANGRVLRRYVAGQGWRYVVVVDALPSLDSARETGARLAGVGQSASIYVINGDEIALAEVVAAATSPSSARSETEAAVAPPPPPAPERPRRGASQEAQAADVLDAAVRAHGGREGGLQRLGEATSVQFRFVRTVPGDAGALVAEHRYLAQGGGLRLDVDVSSGQGQDSVSVVDPSGAAWVQAAGALTPRDARRVREVLDRFGPSSVLAVPLGLPEDVATADAWRSLRLDPTRQTADGGTIVLTPVAATRQGLASAEFDAETHTLRRVTWSSEAGALTFIYDDYRKLDRRLVVPFRARIERDGQLVEEVQVLELLLDQPLDPALFKQPG